MRWFLLDMPDTLARRTSAQERRAFAFWLLVLAMGPGNVASYVWRDSVTWVTVLSQLAFLIGLWSVWSAETPAEVEDVPPTNG